MKKRDIKNAYKNNEQCIFNDIEKDSLYNNLE